MWLHLDLQTVVHSTWFNSIVLLDKAFQTNFFNTVVLLVYNNDSVAILLQTHYSKTFSLPRSSNAQEKNDTKNKDVWPMQNLTLK